MLGFSVNATTLLGALCGQPRGVDRLVDEPDVVRPVVGHRHRQVHRATRVGGGTVGRERQVGRKCASCEGNINGPITPRDHPHPPMTPKVRPTGPGDFRHRTAPQGNGALPARTVRAGNGGTVPTAREAQTFSANACFPTAGLTASSAWRPWRGLVRGPGNGTWVCQGADSMVAREHGGDPCASVGARGRKRERSGREGGASRWRWCSPSSSRCWPRSATRPPLSSSAARHRTCRCPRASTPGCSSSCCTGRCGWAGWPRSWRRHASRHWRWSTGRCPSYSRSSSWNCRSPCSSAVWCYGVG